MDEQQQGGVSDLSGRPIVGYAEEQYGLKDVDGDDIGDIVEINPDFLIVETSGGFLGLGEQRTYYVPRSEIAREEGQDWYLAIDKDQLESMSWSEAPTGSSFAEQDYTAYGDDGGVATQSASLETAEAQPDVQPSRREGTRLVRYEEELQATKTAQQAGEVEIHKEVVEEMRTIEVPVTREEIRVERRPATGETSGASLEGQAFSGDSITVPLMEEEVQVTKVARPVEEVEVSKVQVADTETVSDTVRREEIDIEGEGDLTARRGA